MGCIISREHLLKCEMKCISVIASWQPISPHLAVSMHVPHFYLFFCFHQLLISSINCLHSFSSVSLPNVPLPVSMCFDGGRLVITHHNHNSYHALSTYPQSAIFANCQQLLRTVSPIFSRVLPHYHVKFSNFHVITSIRSKNHSPLSCVYQILYRY